ncbi:hypothetical protein PHYBLDRAFT_149365 [Phycomyces blakesleeanus NRRL 1555(-)]|uniref:Uncharacterized protein n=1 Tax=Phycomyces blakesleeanus (strain ATCC 8743b / DSM 1359 / FGSC 10004 / NBRC 33097 / NRRL 1555) TaxID=763407 RepID=A0A167L4G2_PHYB8|nr:hypothetical protein PHYBLDRAFT_149365 [Phycomyces blakesleeanus NRRL 1555(-)]OAD69577.1 hypothetical protein PHYBLDRAFT_149365 [Phycomyces blakesleeanus NRRL 1555(-)]|eukprot:XP_018287617.1 hypothetical protein PHYBLDRAFT_149365 [Phycomyces blakesleeanus NRRL 1555(-)]
METLAHLSERTKHPNDLLSLRLLKYLSFLWRGPDPNSILTCRPPNYPVVTLGIGWNLTCRSNQLQYWRQAYPFRCLGLCHVPNCPACRTLPICEVPSPAHELRLPVVDLAVNPYEPDTLQTTENSTEESDSINQARSTRSARSKASQYSHGPISIFHSLVRLSIAITSTCPWLVFRLLDILLSMIFNSTEDHYGNNK